MKADNSLSQEFLTLFPAEAARVLEQVSAEHVAALFNELPQQEAAPVAAAMLPETAAACVGQMQVLPAGKLLGEMPLSSAARIYRLLARGVQDGLSVSLPEKIRNRLRRHLVHPPESAGALLDPGVDMLPDAATVGEAIRRIERSERPVNCEIYVVNDTHQLVGVIELGRLLISSHHARLRDVMSRKTRPVSVHASAETLLSHPGWATRRRLPVVERDNTLAGALDYARLQEAVGEAAGAAQRDPMGDLLSLADLYWVSLVQLLDSLFGAAAPNSGERP